MPLGTDKAEIRERLQSLADSNGGRLTPQAVVEDAKREGSPLHELFEWDQRRGHEIYLMHRAREVIRSVKVTIKTSETVHLAPLFTRDPTCEPRQAGYVSVRKLRNETDLARERVVAEFAAAAAALKRAKAVAAALDIGAEVDGLIFDVGQLRDRVVAPATAQAN